MGKKRIVTIGAEIKEEEKGKKKPKKLVKEEKKKEKPEEEIKKEETPQEVKETEEIVKEKKKVKKGKVPLKARPRILKKSKKYQKAAQLVDKNKIYSLDEAVSLVKKTSFTKFDAAVEVHIRLGVDPKKSEQNVRGTVTLPYGTGKTKRILVLTEEKEKEAQSAGADYVGGEDLINKIEGGFSDFDIVLATPEIMPKITRVAKILGQRGLMPNPKSGTIVKNPVSFIKEIKKGKIEFKMDAGGIIHQVVGRASFPEEHLKKNIQTLIDAVLAAKPAGVKGNYILSITLCSTMGPGIKISY